MGAFYAGGPVLSSGSGIGGIGGGEEPVELLSTGQPRAGYPRLSISAETRNGTARGRDGDLGSTRRPQTYRNIFLERAVFVSLVSSRRIIFPR
jgi:hypothetical protein